MEIHWIIHVIILLGLGTASVTDIKKREVPDTLNFVLVILGLLIGIIGSIILGTWQNILSSILGLIIGYIVGALMFYTGQWGGGDAKMLMGMGTLIGVSTITIKNIILRISGQGVIAGLGTPYFITTIITIFVAGGIYGLIYTLFLVIKNWAKFKVEFRIKREEKKIVRMRLVTIVLIFLCGVGIIIISDKFFRIMLGLIGVMFFFAQYLYIISKVIEKVCMIKIIPLRQLTEGDWIVEDVLKPTTKNMLKSLEEKTKQNISTEKNKFFSFMYFELKDLKLFRNNKKIKSFKPITKTAEEINKELKIHLEKNISMIASSQTKNKISFLLQSKTREKEIKKITKILAKKTSEWKKYLTKKQIKNIKLKLKNLGVEENNIRICGPKDLGISLDQIKELKAKKIRNIKIKEGIPFIPGFLLGYLLMIIFGNWMLLII